MKHRLLPLLSILLLIALLALPSMTTEQARAASKDSSCMQVSEMGDSGQPIGLGGGDDNNSPTGSTDSGDGDDPWDGIQAEDSSGHDSKAIMFMVLKIWVETGSVLLM